VLEFQVIYRLYWIIKNEIFTSYSVKNPTIRDALVIHTPCFREYGLALNAILPDLRNYRIGDFISV